MPLDPQAADFLEQLAAFNAPALHQLTPEQARAQLKPPSQPLEPMEAVQNRTIPGPACDIPVRIFTPQHNDSRQSAAGRPLVIYYHGGGWVIGTLDAYEDLCRRLANASGCLVASVDYRLAPEHKYPAAVEDAYAAFEWALRNAQALDVDPARIAVAGDSAGGNLAAAVCLMARDRGLSGPAYQALIYPITNFSFETDSYRENSQGYFLTKATMAWFWSHYLDRDEDGRQPYASPLQSEDLSNLPPAYVLTAEFDPLRDEGEAYAQRLREAGVAVEHFCCEGMIHGFIRRTDVFDRAAEEITQIGRVLKTALK